MDQKVPLKPMQTLSVGDVVGPQRMPRCTMVAIEIALVMSAGILFLALLAIYWWSLHIEWP
jgi:hypothetical protein